MAKGFFGRLRFTEACYLYGVQARRCPGERTPSTRRKRNNPTSTAESITRLLNRPHPVCFLTRLRLCLAYSVVFLLLLSLLPSHCACSTSATCSLGSERHYGIIFSLFFQTATGSIRISPFDL